MKRENEKKLKISTIIAKTYVSQYKAIENISPSLFKIDENFFILFN